MDAKKEKCLIRRAREGDEDAFGPLFEEYKIRLYKWFRRRGCSHEDAEDLTSETFLRAWEKLTGFRFESRFYTWLFAIAFHLWIDLAQRDRNSPELINPRDGLTPNNNPLEVMLTQEEVERVKQALESLTTAQQDVLLRVVNGMTTKEIAEELEITEAAVYNRKCRAIKELKRILAEISDK